MTIHCPECNSTSYQARGTKRRSNGVQRKRYQCNDCTKWFTAPDSSLYVPIENVLKASGKYTSTMPEEYKQYERFVISAVQNDTDVNEEFLLSLQSYCKRNKAKLILVPIRYKFTKESTFRVDPELLVEEDVLLSKKLRLLANIQISPTIETPVAGLDYLSKGNSLIIAHSQLQMRTLATMERSPAILHTTGAITVPNYQQTKTGEKARFNHSMSALVIERDGDQFHLRVLNCDDKNGFYDINGYYHGKTWGAVPFVEALITGDEHAMFVDPEVKGATYLNDDSMAALLKPKRIVRHDVLDFFTGSHHHEKSFLLKYAKHQTGTNIVEDELKLTLKHIADTTPKGAQNIMVSSNHVEHLNQWIDHVDPKQEVWNAHLYYRLMMLMIEHINAAGDTIDIPNAFKIWCENTKHDFDVPPLKWLGRNEMYKIAGIELSNHGDMGANGARGSAVQFSKLPFKMVVGHAHSPSILKGAYTVGTSTGRLEYCKGPSSWANSHVVIYPNGRRQMLFIVNGKWRKA